MNVTMHPVGPTQPPETAYIPGSCNIGPVEVAQRRRAALAATTATLALGGLALAAGAPRRVRALVGIPAALATVSWLQVRNRFCVAYAARGVYNVAQPLGTVTTVAEVQARRADRRRAAVMNGEGLLVGAAVAAGMACLPWAARDR